jgi:glutaminyl-tRNA synthetase
MTLASHNEKRATELPEGRNFIYQMILSDLKTDKYAGKVVTRFPPEPNGYLHIGHAKSLCLNFGIAQDFPGAVCHLRFDDTDPTKEDMEYVNAIMSDVRWLGFEWGDKQFFASDYFERLYDYALTLITKKLAYVCSLDEESMRQQRGTITEAGQNSPHRQRSVEENLDIFARMRSGEFQDGEHVLRAKIDMASPNMKMRDPILYRIRQNVDHYRVGKSWCLYPMYDFTHCLSDAMEGITHSLCTLEFENNREVYDWVLDNLDLPKRPQQTEFARLNLNYTVMSKRKLLQLVQQKHVQGWDDPRMLTIAGLRRRGYTPLSIRAFCESVGVAKAHSTVDMAQLEFCIRQDLNPLAPRVMAVIEPLKVVIENFPEGKTEHLDAPYFPSDVPREGSRQVPFGREIYIEQSDFMEEPSKRYYRLAPGREVRLRYGYVIKCHAVTKDSQGRIIELRCTYDPETLGGKTGDGRKVKGVIHWVSASHGLRCTLRLYDRLFKSPQPGDQSGDFLDDINSNSLQEINTAVVEPSLKNAQAGQHFQFERQGYFFVDPVDSQHERPIFNRVVALKDSWLKSTKEKAPALQPLEKNAPPNQAEKSKVKSSPKPSDNPKVRDYAQKMGVAEAEAAILCQRPELKSYFEESIKSGASAQSVAKWVVNDLSRESKERPLDDLPFTPGQLGELVALVDNEAVSRNVGKDIFQTMLETGHAPAKIVADKGLHKVSDDTALLPLVESVLAEQTKSVADFKAGNPRVLGFLVGQVMRASGGKADASAVKRLLQSRLES